MSKHFTGVALDVSPAEGFRRKDDLRRMHLTGFWHQATGLKGFLIQIFALALLLELFALAAPFFMQLVVDEVIVSHDVDLLLILSIKRPGDENVKYKVKTPVKTPFIRSKYSPVTPISQR